MPIRTGCSDKSMRSRPTRQARKGSSKTIIASSPINLTTRPPLAFTRSQTCSSNRRSTLAISRIETALSSSVDPTRSAKQTVRSMVTACGCRKLQLDCSPGFLGLHLDLASPQVLPNAGRRSLGKYRRSSGTSSLVGAPDDVFGTYRIPSDATKWQPKFVLNTTAGIYGPCLKPTSCPRRTHARPLTCLHLVGLKARPDRKSTRLNSSHL